MLERSVPVCWGREWFCQVPSEFDPSIIVTDGVRLGTTFLWRTDCGQEEEKGDKEEEGRQEEGSQEEEGYQEEGCQEEEGYQEESH